MKLVLTILIVSLNNAALAAGRLLLPIVALSLGSSTFLVGLMSALFTVPPMIFGVGFGRWVDRSGTLKPIVFAGSLIVVSCLFFLLFPNPYVLLPVAGFIGAGAVFAHVAATKAVSGSASNAYRARNLGYLVASYSAFQFLGPMIAGVSYEHLGAAATLATISGFSLLSLATIATKYHHYETHPVQELNENSGDTMADGLMALPRLRIWIFVSAAFSSAQTVLPLVISLHSVEVGLTPSEAAVAVGAFAIGNVTSRLGVARLTTLFPPQRILSVALLSGAALYALLPIGHDVFVLSGLTFLLGLPLGVGVPVSLFLIYEAAPPARVNEAVGLCMAFTNLLQTVVPLASGLVASGFGVSIMTWIISAALIAPVGLAARPPRP